MPNELTVNLQIDASAECLNRLCNGLAAAVKPDGGYMAATSEDLVIGDGGDQMVQVEWWIPQHGCDSLENTLDAIKGKLAIAVRDWWATALIPAAPAVPEVVSQPYKLPEPGEVGKLVAWLRTIKSVQAQKAATLLEQQAAPAPAVVPVAVSERLPGKGDCDAEGRCWVHMPRRATPFPNWTLLWKGHLQPYHGHWLPHYAIPLPQGGEGEA